jgi:hypothetical protein
MIEAKMKRKEKKKNLYIQHMSDEDIFDSRNVTNYLFIYLSK